MTCRGTFEKNDIRPADGLPPKKLLRPFLDELRDIFEKMDQSYRETALRYGFECRGCEKSCCSTKFYHHTFLEFFCLREGFLTLTESERSRVAASAGSISAAEAKPKEFHETTRVMCPLNENGRCRLYAHRPMICRLHGIPHILHHPVKGMITGPGCHRFEATCEGENALKLDRTPFYASLADLEKRLRRTLNLSGKIRMTVADMVARFQGVSES
jgi:Fe-S-cluster containining protein